MPEYELACASIAHGCMNHDVGYAPGLVKMRDPELAGLVRSRLEPYGICVQVTDPLPMLDELIDIFRRDMLPPAAPGWLDAQGMSRARLAGFAEAAAMMFKAAPWRHLANEDLIQIESPMAPAEALSCASVMGAGGDVFGISFFTSRQSFNRLLQQDEPETSIDRHGGTSLTYNSAENLPPGDAELWLTERLSLAKDHAYPLLLRYPPGGGFERLDGQAVTFVEGLCRALAQTTEEQIDSGRWEQTVRTADGQASYVLTIPSLLEAMRGMKPKPSHVMLDRRSMDASMLAIELLMASRRPKNIEEMNAIMARELIGKPPQLPPPTTDHERAQWLCFEAFEHRGRRRIQLAREALRICPDVADAYCLLAEQLGFDQAGANELFRQGVEAGRRALGEQPFNDPDYPFWGAVRSRPYMRARQGYAETLRLLGHKRAAADELQAMLRLNPNDNQGIRYRLAPLLLEMNELDELDQLLSSEGFQGDGSAEWAYVRALLAFRRTAGSSKARSELLSAIESNPHVPKYLLGRAELPPSTPPYFSPGDEREAVIVATSQKSLWEQTPNALDWLGKCKRQVNQGAKRDKRSRRTK
jgi:tetratricopeptide (TPR) repeat protein